MSALFIQFKYALIAWKSSNFDFDEVTKPIKDEP